MFASYYGKQSECLNKIQEVTKNNKTNGRKKVEQSTSFLEQIFVLFLLTNSRYIFRWKEDLVSSLKVKTVKKAFEFFEWNYKSVSFRA